MIQSTVRWLRVTWPPWWAVVCYFLGQAFCVWGYYSFVWLAGAPEAAEPIVWMRRVIAGAACALYGIYRSWGFHPLFSKSYRNWLETTPWTPDKRLPLGPPHLVAQDLVLLGLVWLLLFDPAWGHWIVPLTFLGPYLAFLGGSLWVTGQTKTAWAMAFLAVLAGAVARWPAASLAVVALAIYPLAYLGLRWSLVRFPWTDERERFRDMPLFIANSCQPDRGKVLLGWSYELLAPKAPANPFTWLDRLLLGPLLGCVMATAALHVPKADAARSMLCVAFSLACFVCLGSRLAAYVAHHWPPISLWGRIRLGCWIIPGYDKVFVAPLAVSAIYTGCRTLCQLTAVTPILVIPACTAAAILVALTMGPGLASWRLTGQHRIVPGIQIENGVVGRV